MHWAGNISREDIAQLEGKKKDFGEWVSVEGWRWSFFQRKVTKPIFFYLTIFLVADWNPGPSSQHKPFLLKMSWVDEQMWLLFLPVLFWSPWRTVITFIVSSFSCPRGADARQGWFILNMSKRLTCTKFTWGLQCWPTRHVYIPAIFCIVSLSFYLCGFFFNALGLWVIQLGWWR